MLKQSDSHCVSALTCVRPFAAGQSDWSMSSVCGLRTPDFGLLGPASNAPMKMAFYLIPFFTPSDAPNSQPFTQPQSRLGSTSVALISAASRVEERVAQLNQEAFRISELAQFTPTDCNVILQTRPRSMSSSSSRG